MSASWTGMSGNRFTLATQCWSDPYLAPWHYDMLLATDINNFRLPFYHRMDLELQPLQRLLQHEHDCRYPRLQRH